MSNKILANRKQKWNVLYKETQQKGPEIVLVLYVVKWKRGMGGGGGGGVEKKPKEMNIY